MVESIGWAATDMNREARRENEARDQAMKEALK